MLTKEQEKDLEETLEEFVEGIFTSYTDGPTELHLYYDEEYQKFDTSIDDCYEIYILSRPIINWRDTLCHSLSEEVQDILNNPKDAEYSYPQEIINSVRELVESEDYDIETEAEEILNGSGAADFIGEENAKYYTEVDTGWMKELKKEAIKAYELELEA